MAIKRLKDKVINVRATDKSQAILKVLAERLEISQSEVIELALNELYKIRDSIDVSSK